MDVSMKIKLTTQEQADLRSLAWPPFGQLPTIAAYWRWIYASRGIQWPKQKLPVATPTGQPSEFSISWHGKALGPQADPSVPCTSGRIGNFPSAFARKEGPDAR